MLRKNSTKIGLPEERAKKETNNQYYLPQPHHKITRMMHTQSSNPEAEAERQKIVIKRNRKHSFNPNTMISLAFPKADHSNHSREQDNLPISKAQLNRKVERKIRSTSNGETPRKPISKSTLKLQLTHRRPSKRIPLHIDTANNKKQHQKDTLQEMNYDSYYGTTEARSMRTLRKPENTHIPIQSGSSGELSKLLVRCQLVIEQYSEQLQAVKRQNLILMQQNRRLREQKHPCLRILPHSD